MAGAAEFAQVTQIYEEEYAHSLSSIRRLGSYVTGEVVDPESRIAVTELAYNDFKTALSEMLKTDSEYRQFLDIDNSGEYNIIDGQACAADGRPMVEILDDGLTSSKLARQTNKELEAQVDRDRADLDNAKKVDQIKPGTTRIVLSFDPRDELSKYTETYTDLGYRKGLSYLQFYSKTSEGKVVAGSYSVDQSDPTVWRDIFRDYAVEIPEDESFNNWIRHGIELPATPEQAENIVRQMRKEHNDRLELPSQRYSVSQYVDRNEKIVQSFFDIYYLALSEAVYKGQNNNQLQTLALVILGSDIDKLDPEIRRQLIVVANSSKFKPESAKVMDSIIRYAAAEELRKGLGVLAKQMQPRATQQGDTLYSYPDLVNLNLQVITPQLLASNIVGGILAGREYGGCPGNIKLSDSLNNVLEHSPQEAYGGKDCPEIKHGQKVKCPECKKMVKAIVEDQKDVFCSNPDCKLAKH